MKSQELKKFNLPDAPGVYFFKHGSNILYIGKATSLKDRVKSYFSKDILLTRGTRIVKMLEEADTIKFISTDSVLEALILEANEIKKNQPIFNAREKDDKSHNYVVFTNEEFPRLLIVRGQELKVGPWESILKVRPWKTFGPFPHSGELREGLKIIRKIFPYRDEKCKITPKQKPCFNAQIGLCPGPCAGRISKADYRKIIRNLKLFFEGKKSTLIKTLEREMKNLAKVQKFEEAEKTKRQLFALDHIQDIALIKADLTAGNSSSHVYRIEAYDIAHLSGTNVVGVMTVIEDGELAKSQYRKFKIREDKNDDTKNLKEVLRRRLAHTEWRFPDQIVVDGGMGQINAAEEVIKETGLKINIVSVVKDERHKPKEILKGPTLNTDFQGRTLDQDILLVNAEAHRFAIGYHRKLRGKGFRI